MPSEMVVPSGGEPDPQPDPSPNPAPSPAVPSRRRQIIRQFAQARNLALQDALRHAATVKPDDAARTVALADRTDLPSDVVARNQQQVAAGVDEQDLNPANLAKRHPRLAAWLSDRDNAAIARDELPVLRTLDLAVRQVADPDGDVTGLLPPGYYFDRGAIWHRLPGGLATHVGGFADLDRQLRTIGDAEFDARQRYEELAGGNSFVAAVRAAWLGDRPDVGTEAQEALGLSVMFDPSWTGGLVRAAGHFATDIPKLAAGGILGRGVALASNLGRFRSFFSAAAASQPFALATGAQVAEDSGLANGALAWLVETAVPGVFGRTGVERVLAGAAGRAGAQAGAAGLHGFFSTVLKQGGFELGEEVATELAHAVHERLSGMDPRALEPERLFHRLSIAGALGGIVGGVTNVPGALAEAFGRQVSAQDAIAHRDRLAALVEVAAQAKTSERSAQRFDALVEQLAERDAPVYLQTEDWDASWRAAGVDPSKAAADAGIVRQYLEAKAAGADLAVPLAMFARQAKAAPALLDAARAAPGAPSATEAQATVEALPAEIRAALEREAAAGVAPADAPPDTAPEVGKSVAEQLVAAGTAPDAADRLGQVYEHVFRTLGQRTGTDARKLFDRFRLSIQAKGDGFDAVSLGRSAGVSPEGVLPAMGSAEATSPSLPAGRVDDSADPEISQRERRPSDGDELAQPGGGGRRLGGFVPSRLASDGLAKIFLYEGRNLSTFLHESGHFFLEVLGELAADPEAPATIRADYQAVLAWFGVERREQIEKRHHEQFARGFEAYLFEGKSPVAAMRRVFARLRAWLVDVYKGLKGLSEQAGFEVSVPTEIAAVFDRLIATDEEIASAEVQATAGGIFLTAEAAGMTPERFAGYRRLIADEHERATATLQAQVLKRLTREEQAHQAEVREQVRAEVAAEVDQQPVFRALAVLQRGEMPEGIPAGSQPIKLSREGLLAYLSPDDLKTLPGPGKDRPNRGRHIYAAEGGIHPEAAAQLFGFPSGDAFIQALRNAPDRDATVEQIVDRRMRERFPDPVGPAELEDRAAAAVENDERERVLEVELAALDRLRRDLKPIERQAAAEATEAERQRGDNRVADARQHADAELAYERALAKARIDTLKDEQRAKEKALKTSARGMIAAFKDGREDGETAVPPMAAFRAAAEQVVARTRVRDLRPQTYLIAARRAGKQAFDAAALRQYGKAFEAKQRELLNQALYRAARSARDAADSTREYLKRFDDPATRERIGKAGGWEWTVELSTGPQAVPTEAAARALSAANGNAPWTRTSGYLEQIDKLLERFEFRQLSGRQIDRRQKLAEWIKAVEAQGADVIIPDDIRDEAFKANWRQLTVEQLDGLRDSVKNIEALARTKNRLSKAQKDREFSDAVAAIRSAIETNVRRRPDGKESGDRGLGDRIADRFDASIAAHRKLSSYARQADGGESGGAVWEHLVRPFNEAADAEVEMRAADAERLKALVDVWIAGGKELRPDYGKKHIAAIGKSLSLESRLAVALNWGNAGNRERVMAGHGWNEFQVEAVLATLDEADLKLVQGIWDLINSHWSGIAALEQRLTGVPPGKVEAVPFTVQTADGTVVEMRGGYYPVKYDPALSPRADQQQAASVGRLYALGEASRATTRRNHLRARTEGLGKPLRLDLDVVSEHLAQVIHDLTHREAVRDANRLLNDDVVATTIHERLGRRALEQIKSVVKDIAAADLNDNAVDRTLRWMRNGVSIASMGFNLSTAMMQVTGFAQSAQLVGGWRLARAIGRIFAREGAPEVAYAYITGKSRFMKARTQTALRETAEILGQIRGKAWRQNLTSWSFFLVQRAQMMVDMPTWLAAYEQALERDADEATAVAIADQAVIDTQGSGLTKDLSGVQRSRITQLFTVFYSYFSTTFNRTAEAWAGASRKGWTPETVARLAIDMVWLYLLPGAMVAALRMLRGGGEDDESFLRATAKETLSTAMGTVIGLRELTGPLIGSFEYRGPAGAMAFATMAELIAQAKQGDLDEGLLKAAARTGGVLFHVPTAQLIKTIEGFAEMEKHGLTAPIFGPPPKRR